MVRVSVCPSLTEGLSRSQMTPGQLLAVDHCKMLPLKPSHNAALAGLSSDILLSAKMKICTVYFLSME